MLHNLIENSKNNRFFYFLLAGLVALVVADGTITRFLISHEFGTEANPFLEAWVESDTLLLLKLAGAGIAAVMLWRVSRKYPKLAWLVTLSFLVIYSGIIIWNLSVFFTIHRELTGFIPAPHPLSIFRL